MIKNNAANNNLNYKYNYTESISDYETFCADDYNAKAYRDIFSRQVGWIFKVLAAGSFIGLAVYKPEVLIALRDRIAQHLPAVVNALLKSLDFTNSMIVQTIGTMLSCGTCYRAMSHLMHYSLYFVIKLIFIIGRKMNFITTSPRLLNTEPIRQGLEKFKAFKDKNPKGPITAAKFDEIVQAFKKSFGLKSIKKAFSCSSAKEMEGLPLINVLAVPYMSLGDYSNKAQKDRLFDIFISDPDIREYLSREKVQYKGNLLALESKYERNFYNSEFGSHIHYRNSDSEDVCETFYKQGSNRTHMDINFSIEQPKILKLLKENTHFSFDDDIYQVAQKTNKVSKFNQKNADETKFNYHLFIGAQDDHSYLTISIFEGKGGLVCLLLINSFSDESYHKDLAESISFMGITGSLIDCSLKVQDEDDGNCILYSGIIARAFVQLLANQQEESDNAFENYKNSSEEFKNQAEKNLQQFIRSNIVRYLPEYYAKNEKGNIERKPMEELRAFHMQRRWDIGNVHIDELVKQAKERSVAFDF